MIKYLATILASISLISCATNTYSPDPRLDNIETQLVEYKQYQSALISKLDKLTTAQEEANKSIKAEISTTQNLLAKAIPSSQLTQSEEPEHTKAQWLKNEGKVIVGGVEKITFTAEDIDLTYTARIDTGATSSSLDAREISQFERDGDRWVKFQLYVDDQHHADIERPVIRWVRIFQSATEQGERRPVVKMAYKFGSIMDTAEFTLADRSHLEHSTLIGRNIMTDRMIVDVSHSFMFSEQ